MVNTSLFRHPALVRSFSDPNWPTAHREPLPPENLGKDPDIKKPLPRTLAGVFN